MLEISFPLVRMVGQRKDTSTRQRTLRAVATFPRLVEVDGIEPTTSGLQSRRSPWVDLNYRPHAYQACALTKLSYRPTTVGQERTCNRHEVLARPSAGAFYSVLSASEPGRDTPAATRGFCKVSGNWNFFQRLHP